MQTPIVLSSTHGLTFKKDLSQIEYYGIYTFVAEAFTHAAEENYGGCFLGFTANEAESRFGFIPSGGAISCNNHVLWPGFEHLGPVDYFTLTENHILCAAFIVDDDKGRAEFNYLRLN